MADSKRIDEPTGTETVGHEWDGIEELDTPMPRWWLWTLYATIAWALIYTVLYPAWPLINKATAGVWNWSSREQFAAEMKAERDRKRPVELALAQLPIERLPEDSKLLNAAVQGGAAAFKVNCVQCHGSGAAGSKGYPNLNDDDWLWGGDLKAIHQTLEHGIRQPGNEKTRGGAMPAFGGGLSDQQIEDVALFVRTLSGAERPSAASLRGQAVFAGNCAVCHGASGTGTRAVGAPNLTDKIWLFGGDRDTIIETITKGRGGIMPSWGNRLDAVTVKMLAAYVHSLGGGEAFVPEVASAAEAGKPKTEAAAVPAAIKQNATR
ncbi:cytochrome-c oxidase, cbb3-type subunit III [Sphingomonas sp. HDW15A]|uniref:cytochrome-c oxidase, cbb3-type subunit III n=1 Tax=Sphingomonas sp. HDW15A TaxID=2714942 RepID=UPI00140E0168|nr:cytochrome-c oxidase, cbb3-type subunit III [Sphingomonas sp. HDW15A]QIK95756.1 cytochrome-c oxidase, cbb3-type subunit III [Sphingomonas sp. HDW15A]